MIHFLNPEKHYGHLALAEHSQHIIIILNLDFHNL